MRRSLRPNAYARMIENQFVSAESQFVDMAAWDACVQPDADAERGAAAGVGWRRRVDQARQHRAGRRQLRQEEHMCAPGRSTACSCRAVLDPIDFEATVERDAAGLAPALPPARGVVRSVPDGEHARSAWPRRTLPIEEFPQTVPNLTAATQNLFDLIQSRQLVLYPDAAMRLAASPRHHRRELARLAARQAQAAAQDRRGGRAEHGGARRGARAGEARLRSCSRPACSTTTLMRRISRPATNVIGASWARIFMPVLEFGRDEPR